MILTGIMFASCEPRMDSPQFTPQIVVEGYMEEGRSAVVSVSTSVFVEDNVDSDDIYAGNIPIYQAKVTLSDGENEEVLIGRRDDNYPLKFIYTGSMIRGETGKSYYLTVEYSGRTATAVTTIPDGVEFGNINVHRSSSDKDGYEYGINIGIRKTNEEKQNYVLFARNIEDGIFLPCFFGVFDDSIMGSPDASVAVYRPMSFIRKDSYKPLYKSNEHIILRLASVPRDAFDFWSSYNNEILNSDNPLYPNSSNLASNIAGGLGIWCGFSAVYQDIRIEDWLDN